MDKQYIISFLATLRGEKTTTQGLMRMEQKTGRLIKTTKKASTATKTYAQTMGILAKRALLVIPIWLLLRTAFMGVVRLIGSMVKGYLDLEDGLARIQTVVHGTTEEINSQMQMIKTQIKDVATKTRVPLKELAETFYYLKTASLTTTEAMGAFEHTVDAMTGTGIKGKEMARAIAGVYNTMGKYILEGASASEKMKKIADILTYTYATQDVQMDELIQGYTKLAPFIAGLSDSFSDLVTMIGWLNTKMLRAGRTGRLTARAFLQITKNADKLASTFGVTFDPDAPLNFMRIMGDINKVIKTQGKITAGQTEALRRIFATRALTPVQLIIKDYDDLVEAQKRAVEEAENFAKEMAEIKMGTIRGQMERMSNIMKILFEDFVSATQGTGDYVEALKRLADQVESMRPDVTSFGHVLSWIGHNLSQLGIQYEALFISIKKQSIWEAMNIGGMKWWKDYTKLEVEMGRKYLTMAQWAEEMIKTDKKVFEDAKKNNEKKEKAEIKLAEIADNKLSNEKLYTEELKHEVAVMKIMGATAEEIARFRLESLEVERLTPGEKRAQQQIRLNALIREELKSKEQVRKVMQDLYVDYMKANQTQDKESKERIRSLMNALTFEPDTMTIWWRTATDEWREMILENWDLLTEAQQDALREYWEATGQVPPSLAISPTAAFEKRFAEDITTTFWEMWMDKMESMGALDLFEKRFLAILEKSTKVEKLKEGERPIPLGKYSPARPPYEAGRIIPPEPLMTQEDAQILEKLEQERLESQKRLAEELLIIERERTLELEKARQQQELIEESKKRKDISTEPTVTEITINISRIDAKGVTAKEVENAIPGALAKAIEREEIIKKIRRKV